MVRSIRAARAGCGVAPASRRAVDDGARRRPSGCRSRSRVPVLRQRRRRRRSRGTADALTGAVAPAPTATRCGRGCARPRSASAASPWPATAAARRIDWLPRLIERGGSPGAPSRARRRRLRALCGTGAAPARCDAASRHGTAATCRGARQAPCAAPRRRADVARRARRRRRTSCHASAREFAAASAAARDGAPRAAAVVAQRRLATAGAAPSGTPAVSTGGLPGIGLS